MEFTNGVDEQKIQTTPPLGGHKSPDLGQFKEDAELLAQKVNKTNTPESNPQTIIPDFQPPHPSPQKGLLRTAWMGIVLALRRGKSRLID